MSFWNSAQLNCTPKNQLRNCAKTGCAIKKSPIGKMLIAQRIKGPLGWPPLMRSQLSNFLMPTIAHGDD